MSCQVLSFVIIWVLSLYFMCFLTIRFLEFPHHLVLSKLVSLSCCIFSFQLGKHLSIWLVTIWILSFVAIWVLSCHNLSFKILSKYGFLIFVPICVSVLSHFELLSFTTVNFFLVLLLWMFFFYSFVAIWVWSQIEIFSFVTIWVFAFCPNLSHWVLLLFELLSFVSIWIF